MATGGRPRQSDTVLEPEAAQRGALISKLRSEHKLSQTELAGHLYGADQSYISKLERGVVDPGGVGVTRFVEIAIAFDMSVSELAQALGIEPPSEPDPLEPFRIKVNFAPIPRLGLVAAGEGEGNMPEPDGTFSQVPIEDLKRRGAVIKNCFSYKVNGNSMFTEASKKVPRPLAHGDTVVIERNRIARGDDLVVLWDHVEQKMLIKAVSEGESSEYLVFTSYNASNPPIVRSRDQVKVYGVVVWRGG